MSRFCKRPEAAQHFLCVAPPLARNVFNGLTTGVDKTDWRPAWCQGQIAIAAISPVAGKRQPVDNLCSRRAGVPR